MASPSRTEQPVFRVPLRFSGRVLLNAVIGFVGLGITLALFVSAAASVSDGGLLTGAGLSACGVVAGYLYGPNLVRFLRVALRKRPYLRLLDEDGVRITHGPALATRAEASLPWSDCAAVVSSPLPELRLLYVQFVSARPDAVRLPADLSTITQKARTLAAPEHLAAMTSYWRPANRRELDALLEWVRRHHPDLRIVESGQV